MSEGRSDFSSTNRARHIVGTELLVSPVRVSCMLSKELHEYALPMQTGTSARACPAASKWVAQPAVQDNSMHLVAGLDSKCSRMLDRIFCWDGRVVAALQVACSGPKQLARYLWRTILRGVFRRISTFSNLFFAWVLYGDQTLHGTVVRWPLRSSFSVVPNDVPWTLVCVFLFFRRKHTLNRSQCLYCGFFHYLL